MAVKKQFTSFDALLSGSDLPVLVDFYATWCGPCQMMAPILEQVGDRLKGRVQIVKIDTDKYPNLASQYQINALPTLVLFKNAQPVERIEGLVQADRLIERLRSLV
ncbi:MAG TPA: thioredoxin [Cyanobacteria bacterium UBA11149]|nr:thioredoxin [Cyanobacteria bacterium UBA11367]HBE56902.1 thioredoxin [Cyanobacteria bacterium UBA11366]HBK64576.1 thioredoxin [Cyanobacteria bacterium UBA11166]HBR75923.1 thioredoxin [Cyanobacteria bacterium UBA11159]HBS69691.1 thioredoxin [Cyanobacteria bacterium UBA11153]HBW92180.1 thioredoxin [Cyanobacteria bacterium UBA11149]HCA95325.1 thioredoxin [Cyanobacteria bacterium UBA9226]